MRRKTLKRRPYNIPRRRKMPPRAGYFKVIRWSSAVSGNRHLTIVGNDTIFSGTNTTTFALNNVNGVSELVSLFDNFRVVKVLYRWVCLRNPDLSTGTNKGLYPRINWTHDFNDSTIITRDQIYQRANMKEVYFTDSYQKTRWYSLNPSILMQAYESGVATAYSPKWRQWLDTSDQATPFYGIKYAWDTLFAGVEVAMEAKLIIECKGIS